MTQITTEKVNNQYTDNSEWKNTEAKEYTFYLYYWNEWDIPQYSLFTHTYIVQISVQPVYYLRII